jgi:hypothetical protein
MQHQRIEFLNSAEVADVLGLSEETVSRFNLPAIPRNPAYLYLGPTPPLDYGPNIIIHPNDPQSPWDTVNAYLGIFGPNAGMEYTNEWIEYMW